jgi:hypothetical protein
MLPEIVSQRSQNHGVLQVEDNRSSSIASASIIFTRKFCILHEVIAEADIDKVLENDCCLLRAILVSSSGVRWLQL